VHLAGAGIAQRWTPHVRREIRESRVQGTALLARTVARLRTKPEVLVCSSGIGIYGSRGDEWLDESSGFGDDFLAEVGQAWEAAATPAREAGVRVVERVVEFVIATSAVRGAVNTVSPEPVTNATFAATLGRVLRRPAILPAPAFALGLVFGEMAKGTILASQRVRPAVLERAGFRFQHATLTAALRAELGLP
jgi:NAD dependent epimerase/dehydratase family enzyme